MLGHDSRSLALLLDAEQSLSTAHAVDVALAVCAAVRPLHDRGTIHGALSVHAVSLARGAEGVRDIHVLGADAARALVDSEQILRAPEQLDDRRPDARTDVWGIGVLLYTMLAGAPPFVADSPSAINLSLVLDDAPSLAGVPDALAEIVDACLSKNPALRPVSLTVLENKLRPFASSVPGAPESTARREVVAAAMLRDASSLEILVDVEPSVRDVTAPAPPLRAERPATLRPIARTLPPPVRGSRLWQVTAAGLAAACLLVSVGVGFVSRRATVVTAPPTSRHAAVEARAAQPPPTPDPSPVRAPEADTAVPASALPAAGAPSVHPRARSLAAKPRSAPAERAPRSERVTPAAPPAETAPATTEAHAEPKPETKAADDDLRHYLDDRR